MNSGTGGIACTGTGRQIASLPGAYPIADISQITSASYCANIGAHLITNNEWQTIAWNAENVASNWSGGTVGTGNVPRGNSDSGAALVADPNNANGYAGEIAGQQNDGVHKRTLTLSNGSVIWDMAGNVWQWTNNTILDTQEPHGATAGWSQIDFTSIIAWGGMTQQTVGPSNSTWIATQGMGQLYSINGGTGVSYGFLRGGYWGIGAGGGVEALGLGHCPSQRVLQHRFPLRPLRICFRPAKAGNVFLKSKI
jgi:formylglycine-generating enzyme required for sulfatase activity